MRNKLIATAALVCSALAVATSIPSSVQAQNDHRHRVRVCRDESTRGSRNTGTVVGAVTGGLLGNALSHGGGKTGGTIIGAAAGAAVGSNVARSSINCDNGRPYFSREQTADYDSYQGYRGQHDDAWYRQHDCRWVRSDRDDYIRVCRGRNDNYYPEY